MGVLVGGPLGQGMLTGRARKGQDSSDPILNQLRAMRSSRARG